MTARSYLYRRNGIYYFRWPIPTACRQRMPSDSPVELRTSLRTSHPATARHLAARHWLAALDAAQRFLVSDSPLRYNDLLNAIRRQAGMDGRGTSAQADEGTRVSLGEVAGSVEPQKLKDALEKLDRAGATFYLAVPNQPVEVWGHVKSDDGVPSPQIIEALPDFADDHARLTRKGIRAALAADRNLIAVTEVHSNQPGLYRGDEGQQGFYDIVLTPPVTCNLSELKVDVTYAQQVHIPTSPAPSTTSAAADCGAIRLSEAKDTWVKENRVENGGSWKKATVDNYESYVRQFIVLVGDKLTTDLKPNDFSTYEAMMRALPSDWFAQHRRTGMTPKQISLINNKAPRLSPKSLKDKGSAISLFFSYLKGKGYWHGRYGTELFSSIKSGKGKKNDRPSFTNGELEALFSGAGIETFKKAKFPLYLWGTVLLLYTGARPAEISQLLRQDVVQDDKGTWYLKLTDEGGESGGSDGQKQFKTESSIRSIPLHPQVISLGFLEFIKRFAPNDNLFPEAFRHSQKVSREIGDWFNGKLLKDAGLKRDGFVLYSLRHTVINRFKANAELDHYACAYTGHSTADDKVSSNRIYREQYGRGFSPTTLAEKLHPLLNFDIDWTPLKTVIDEKGWASPSLTQPLRAPAKEAPKKPSPRNTKLVKDVP